jgi:hypothetical protein
MAQSTVICPRCGAPRVSSSNSCPYCGTIYEPLNIPQGKATRPGKPNEPGDAAGRDGERPPGETTRVTEPNEGAFGVTIPAGWKWQGGVIRSDLSAGPANTVAAKVDFAVMKDDSGSTMIRWLPDFYYLDQRGFGNLFGMMQQALSSQRMAIMPSAQFLVEVVFRQIHRQASGVQIIEQRPQPGIVQAAMQDRLINPAAANFSYDAASVTIQYVEGGLEFKELLLTTIENDGPMSGGLWRNRDTRYCRAPVNEFDAAAQIFMAISSSIQYNPLWMQNEIQGELMRSGMPGILPDQLNYLTQEVLKRAQISNSIIAQAMFGNLANQFTA